MTRSEREEKRPLPVPDIEQIQQDLYHAAIVKIIAGEGDPSQYHGRTIVLREGIEILYDHQPAIRRGIYAVGHANDEGLSIDVFSPHTTNRPSKQLEKAVQKLMLDLNSEGFAIPPRAVTYKDRSLDWKK